MADTHVRNLAEEAAFQWGLFTEAQAEKLGVSRGRLDILLEDGQVQSADAKHVYRFAGAPVDAMLDALRTQWLALRPDRFLRERLRGMRDGRWDTAIVSHVSAACLVHDLGTLTPHALDFTVTGRSDLIISHPDYYVRSAVPEWQSIDGLPVTTIPQTIADLHAENVDYGHIGDVIYDALMRSCVDFRSISEALDAVTERSGRETMLHMLNVIGAPRDVVEALELVSQRNWQHGNWPAKGRN